MANTTLDEMKEVMEKGRKETVTLKIPYNYMTMHMIETSGGQLAVIDKNVLLILLQNVSESVRKEILERIGGKLNFSIVDVSTMKKDNYGLDDYEGNERIRYQQKPSGGSDKESVC